MRAQVVTPRPSRRVNKARPRSSKGSAISGALKHAAHFARPAALLVAALLLVLGYRALAGSELFELRQIHISDANPALKEEIEDVVRRAVGQSRLLEVDLEAIREKVEDLARVRSASVSRVLPDGIHVRVFERQAAVLARRESGALVWLDNEAVEMGEFSSLKVNKQVSDSGEAHAIPPTVKGFAEGNRSQGAIAEDRERIDLYKQMEQEFSQPPNPVWDLIDEIDLTYTKNVNLRLANSVVRVVVGGKDFRNRFETALKILKAIEEGDSELLSRYRVQNPERLIENAGNINFIDTSRPDRIVLNFSTPGTEKPSRQEPNKQTAAKNPSKEKKG